jgi:iron complex transport system substrate-binding protein
MTSVLDAEPSVKGTCHAPGEGEAESGAPRWDQLRAVKAGAVSVLDYAAVSGLNTPSPLSVPYSLKLIRPALEKATAE